MEGLKYKIGAVAALAAGVPAGFFGVLLSLFAGGPPLRRLMTVGIVLLIYFVLGCAAGYFLPAFSWRWGLFIGAPGGLILLMYLARGFRIFHMLYMLLIFLSACLGALAGRADKQREKRRKG